MCLDPQGTPEQMKVRGMSAYAGRSFEDIIIEEIAELQALGINVRLVTLSSFFYLINSISSNSFDYGCRKILCAPSYC